MFATTPSMKSLLASLLVLPVALFASCTVSVNSNTDGGLTTVDAGTDSSSVKTDGGGGGGVCGRTPTAAEYNELYKPATARVVGACSATEIAAMNAAQTYGDVLTAVNGSASCKACATSLDSAANWAPLVVNAMGELYSLNFGACAEAVSGNTECGKVDAKYYNCDALTCDGCSDDEFDACSTAAYEATGTCNVAYENGDFGSCPDADGMKIQAACGDGDIVAAIGYLCGPASADASAE